MDHRYKTPADCDCDGSGRCNICDGGLCLCLICGGLEGALTSECPGRRLTADEIDEVYAGRLDYRAGTFVAAASRHCPAGIAERIAALDAAETGRTALG